MSVVKKKLNRSAAVTIIQFVFLFLVGAFMALPLVLVISNALKPLDELFVFPPRFLPHHPTLNNFKELMSLMDNSWVPVSRYLFNTGLLAVVGTMGQIILASMCAFILTKRKFPGRDKIFKLIWLTLMFSASVTAIPNYIIMSALGWVDTYFALIVPALGQPMGLYLMKQFMEQVPDSLIESAGLDGASDWRVFINIVMPIVKPAWLTLMIFSFQAFFAIGENIFIYSENLKTFPYALQQIAAGGVARVGVSSAAMFILMIIPVIMFLVSQSSIMETMATSGMKD